MAFGFSDRLTAKTVLATFAATGTKAPKPLLDAWERLERITRAVQDLAPPLGALPVAVFAAVDRGDDPAVDGEVRRILAQQAIAHDGIRNDVPAIAYDLLRETARTHTDKIVATWRTPFDRAAAVLAEVLAQLGDVDLDDATAIITKGGDAAESWGKAQTAIATVEAIRAGWLALATFTSGRAADKRHAVLAIADVGHADWERLALVDQKPDPWEATRQRLPLSLPTPAEFAQRVARLQHAQQAEADRQEKAARDHALGRRTSILQ